MSDTPYGLCPICGAPGKTRERRPDGNDTCENGCVYKSKNAWYGPAKREIRRTPMQGAIQLLGPGAGMGGGMAYFFDMVEYAQHVNGSLEFITEIEKVGPLRFPFYGSNEGDMLLAQAEFARASAINLRKLMEGKK